MKIVYCIHSTYNPGGMERVLFNKVNYLVEEYNYEVSIITTEQQNNPHFFYLSEKVICYDLDINYFELNINKSKNISVNFFNQLLKHTYKKRIHKRKLTELLYLIKPDIVVSMYEQEFSFLYNIDDGSKKIVESHFCKSMRLEQKNSRIWKLIAKLQNVLDEYYIRKYDRFVVLTQEDRGYWGKLENIEVISNAVLSFPEIYSDLNQKNVLAVGRLSYQKGYDRLILAWKKVCETIPEWSLNIYGSGELRDQLMKQIQENGLESRINIYSPVSNISEVYKNSSLLVMSSRYEGFPMVILEAMSYGLPIVSFNCKCGPTDAISHMKDGLLVEEGNIDLLAGSLIIMIRDFTLRKSMGENAIKKSKQFSQDRIMEMWKSLFEQIV